MPQTPRKQSTMPELPYPQSLTSSSLPGGSGWQGKGPSLASSRLAERPALSVMVPQPLVSTLLPLRCWGMSRSPSSPLCNQHVPLSSENLLRAGTSLSSQGPMHSAPAPQLLLSLVHAPLGLYTRAGTWTGTELMDTKRSSEQTSGPAQSARLRAHAAARADLAQGYVLARAVPNLY